MKRKRKTSKPAPKAKPKRDWMDQDPHGQGLSPCIAKADPASWGWVWPFPFFTGITSAMFHDDIRSLPISWPYPSEYTR
jgi:hypothetical protein